MRSSFTASQPHRQILNPRHLQSPVQLVPVRLGMNRRLNRLLPPPNPTWGNPKKKREPRRWRVGRGLGQSPKKYGPSQN